MLRQCMFPQKRYDRTVMHVASDALHGHIGSIALQLAEEQCPGVTHVLMQWNPWEAMKDCYQRFACVENAKFNSPAVVQPGESWRAQQEFAVIDL